MKNITTFLFLVVSILLHSCATEEVTEKETDYPYIKEDIQNYLKLNNVEIEDGFVVILNNNHCGGCNVKTREFLKQTFSASNNMNLVRKHFFLANTETVLEELLKNLENSQIFIDKNDGELLLRSGLNFPLSVVFRYKNKKIIYWEFIKIDNLEEEKTKFMELERQV